MIKNTKIDSKVKFLNLKFSSGLYFRAKKVSKNLEILIGWLWAKILRVTLNRSTFGGDRKKKSTITSSSWISYNCTTLLSAFHALNIRCSCTWIFFLAFLLYAHGAGCAWTYAWQDQKKNYLSMKFHAHPELQLGLCLVRVPNFFLKYTDTHLKY